MKRLLLAPLILGLALPTAVQAKVDPHVHSFCKEVDDYSGCMQSHDQKENFFNRVKKK